MKEKIDTGGKERERERDCLQKLATCSFFAVSRPLDELHFPRLGVVQLTKLSAAGR